MVGAGLLTSRPVLCPLSQLQWRGVVSCRSQRSLAKVKATATPSNGGKAQSTKKTTKTTPNSRKKAEDIVKDDVDAAADTADDIVDDVASSAKRATKESRASTSSQASATKDNVDSTAASVKGGIDDVAGSTKRNVRETRATASSQASSVKEDVDEGADALKEGVDQAADQVSEFAADAEANLDEAVEQGAEQLDRAANQVQGFVDEAQPVIAGAVQQAVDSTAEGISGAQRALDRASEPGPPAPFARQSLTNLPVNPFEGRPGPQAGEERQVDYYKKRLLYCVAGLDRGLAASGSAAAEVESAVFSLSSATSPVILSWTSEAGATSTTLAQLNGTWRLVYSSSFARGNLGGGSSSGPPVGLLPAQLGQVYQTISAYTSRLDNVVELYSRVGLPQLPGLPEQEPVVTTLTLRHLFEPVGGSTAQITFEDTEVKTTGGIGGFLGKLPELRLPQLPEALRPSRDSRTSSFETLFMDDELRVSRGRRGELRIFIKT